MGLQWLPPHIAVANTFNHEASIAEYVLMSMLLLSRHPHFFDQQLRSGNWDGSCIEPVLRVLEALLCWSSGSAHRRKIIRRASAFGLRTVAVSRRPDAVAGVADQVAGYDNWRNLLPKADFVVPCCP